MATIGFQVMNPEDLFLQRSKYGEILRFVREREEGSVWETEKEAHEHATRAIRKVGDLGVEGYRIVKGERVIDTVVVKAEKMELLFEKRRVSDLLICALEGGSNYWYQIEEYVEPPVIERHTGLDGVFKHADYPLTEGGAIIISDARAAHPENVKKVRLDWPAICEGLAVMSRRYPRHFGHWLSEDDDADTGDVFLQCCLFGEAVYG